jgi:hypothetical protein
MMVLWPGSAGLAIRPGQPTFDALETTICPSALE